MSEIPTHTQVVVIGGGPAGSLLAYLLHLRGIDSVIVSRVVLISSPYS